MEKETKKKSLSDKIGSKLVKRASKQHPEDHTPITSAVIHNAPRHKNLKYLLISVCLLLVVSGMIVYFFTGAHRSLAKIYLGSVPIKADMEPKVLEELVSKANKQYELTLEYTNGEKKAYPLETVGVAFDSKASAKKVKQSLSSHNFRRLKWWEPINIPMSVKTDQRVLRNFIDGQATQAKKAPQDATLTISNGTSVVTAEVAGEGDSIKNAEDMLPLVVSNMQKPPVKLTPGKVEPAIKAGDLNSSKQKLDSVLAQKIVLNIDSRAITAKPTDIAEWVELTPVKSAKTVDVTINSGKIVKYIDKIARPYVQPPRSKLIVKLPEGEQVIDHGKNGIDVINKDQAASSVAQAVNSGKSISTNLDVKYAASKTVEVQPYDKWIVVDVTTKRMYAYEQTNLVKSFLISAGAPKTPTVLGQYKIFSKTTSQDMRGFNADGSRYFQPRVPYVNYFYKDYAVHGNYWRPTSYFGNINSSHGCVGLQVAESEWVYHWAPIGTPVIVHN